MKCVRVDMEAEVVKYEMGKGIEDGQALWTDVVTKGLTVLDKLVRFEREDGKMVCPYIKGSRGPIFIEEGDYVITDSDGTRHVCGENKIWSRYKKCE